MMTHQLLISVLFFSSVECFNGCSYKPPRHSGSSRTCPKEHDGDDGNDCVYYKYAHAQNQIDGGFLLFKPANENLLGKCSSFDKNVKKHVSMLEEKVYQSHCETTGRWLTRSVTSYQVQTGHNCGTSQGEGQCMQVNHGYTYEPSACERSSEIQWAAKGYLVAAMLILGILPSFIQWYAVRNYQQRLFEAPIVGAKYYENKEALQADLQAGVEMSGECVICLDEWGPGAVIKLPCGHYFHVVCVNEWWSEHTTCPCCRREMVKEDIRLGWKTAVLFFVVSLLRTLSIYLSLDYAYAGLRMHTLVDSTVFSINYTISAVGLFSLIMMSMLHIAAHRNDSDRINQMNNLFLLSFSLYYFVMIIYVLLSDMNESVVPREIIPIYLLIIILLYILILW
jgi:hypothetical protein